MRISRNQIILTLLCTVSLFIAACGNTSTEQQTLDVFSTSVQQQMDSLHSTATVQIERILVTVERAETQVARANLLQSQMILTLEERGEDISNLPAAVTPDPEQTDNVVPDGAVSAPQVTPAAQITPPSSPATASPAPDQNLVNIVMAEGVDANDCAVGVTNQFTPQHESIYVVALARDIADGTSISTRWWRDNEEVVNFDLTFDFIEEACIWFFVDQTDFAFTPGNYSVQFYIAGNPVGQAQSFVVAGAAAPLVEVTPEGTMMQETP